MNENKELIQLHLSEKNEDGNVHPIADLLKDIGEALPGLFVDLSDAGVSWFKGKSAQEVAKAQQILADAIERIGRMQLDDRDQRHRHKLELEKHKLELAKTRQEMYLTGLERVTRVAKELSEVGIDVDLASLINGILTNINATTSSESRSIVSTNKIEEKSK